MLSDYSLPSQWLHRAVLSNRMLGRTLFDIDKLIAPKSNANSHPVFIAGLPRAGTTFMLNLLAGSGNFSTLTYRDMPFVMMPHGWRRLRGKFQKDAAPKERFHADGVVHGYDSPESFEEIFWRTMDSDNYVYPQNLAEHKPPSALLDKFKRYTALVAGRKRYLSKNNANILRLPALQRAFPQGAIIVMVRDPLQQAHSMLVQHRKFSAEQKNNRFFSDYIGWLGHDEFGLHHKPCVFGAASFLAYDKNTLDYWLAYWVHVYSWLAEHRPGNARFASYDALCRQPDRLKALLEEHGVTPQASASIHYSFKDISGADKSLLDQATVLHQRLLQG